VNIKNIYEHWDDIYTKNHPEEVSWFQKEPTISLNIIQRLSNNKAHIIDIGGGASVLTDYLLKIGYSNVSVLDISKKAIEHAKRRLAEQAVKVEWYVQNVTDFTPSYLYDIWHDRAVFHFLLDSKSRNLYINTLKKALKDDGYALIATFAKDGPKKCSGLDIVRHDSLSIQHELGDEFTLLENQSEIHLTPKGKEQHFNYFLFQRHKK